MKTSMEENYQMFARLCVKLSHNTPRDKLKQLKFLLQDVTSEMNDINDKKSFLDLIQKLDSQGVLNKKSAGKNEALLLIELFDTVSLQNLADQICSEFVVERGNISIQL